MAVPYDPNFTMAVTVGASETIENDGHQEHNASASAAIVAVELISTARLELNLDSVYTEYSAQYLVNNARPKKKGGRKKKKGSKKKGGKKSNLTVKRCLEFALKNGIPKAEDWPPLGSVTKPDPSSHKPALVFMEGEVIEAKNMMEADGLLRDQPVGVKLHVFTPHIDLVGDGIYSGGSSENDGDYVGLRDGILVGVEKIQGKSIATVKLWYKNKFQLVNVAMSRMFALGTLSRDDGSLDYSRGIGPTCLLVDICALRLSIS